MVAIVTGSGLGLFNASNNILGLNGGLGRDVLGQAGSFGYVNAASGNLVLRQQDEVLSGRGAELLQARTYNSRGTLTDVLGTGTGWTLEAERSVSFDETTGAAGSSGTVRRTTSDGATQSFTWSTSLGLYLSDDGAGAQDSLSYSTSTHRWTYTDGSSRQVEVYGDSTARTMIGRLQTQTDASGNVLSYTYDTNQRLSSIIDGNTSGSAGSQQKLQFTYDSATGRLTTVSLVQLNVDGSGRAVGTLGTALANVTYQYYSSGRLKSVTTDLTPNDTSDNTNPAKLYTTTYTYVTDPLLDPNLIASVTQSDGTAVSFEYYTSGADLNKVKKVTTGSGTGSMVQQFAYGSGQTTVTEADGRNWIYKYDSHGQLTEIDAPSPGGGQSAPVTSYQYDGRGNLTQVTQVVDGNAAHNRIIRYEYDARDNRTLERDALGNTMVRAYDTNNQLISETHYTGVDANGLDPTNTGTIGGTALTTHYIYDSQSRLRFVVSAEGRVMENRYESGGFGLLTRTIVYAGGKFDPTTLNTTGQEAQLASWAAGQDQQQTELTQYTYDLRGNLASKVSYATVNASGVGQLDSAATVLNYIYDGHGALLQMIAMRGASHTTAAVLTSVGYDGLGREITRTNASGTTSTVYDDAHGAIQITNTDSKLRELRTFDSAGRLTSVVQSDSTSGSTTPSRTTQYLYDAAGRVQVVQTIASIDTTTGVETLGARTFNFYDADGRLQYTVGANGEVCGYSYDASGLILTQTCYANAASTTGWVTSSIVTLQDGSKKTLYTVAKSALTVGTSGTDVLSDAGNDRTISYTYDQAGRLMTTTDAVGTVTTTAYDGASRVTSVQVGGARTTRYYRDADGNEVGVVDALGYLTERKYDAANHLIETVRYTTRSQVAIDTAAPRWVGLNGSNTLEQTVLGNQALRIRLPIIDADGDAVRDFSFVGTVPSWLSLDSSGEGGVVLTGTPPATLTSYTVKVRAVDARGVAGSDATVKLTVVNSAPSWAELRDDVVRVNTGGYRLTLAPAVDVQEGTSLSYSINAALLPPGMTFDAPTRTLSGTPTTPGIYQVTARASDSQGGFTERTFTLTVTNTGPYFAGAVNEPPVVSANRSLSFTIPEAIDPEGQTITYTKVSGPSWLTLSGRTLSGLAPHDIATSSFAVVIQARDPNGEVVVLSFSVTVKNDAPVWKTTPWNIGAVQHGVPFPTNMQLPGSELATDPNGDTLTYSAVSGLPPGLTVNANGTFSGSASAVGSFTIRLRATDKGGLFTEREVTLNLTNQAPVYQSGLPSSLTVQGGAGVDIPFPAGTFTDPNGDALSYEVTMRVGGVARTSWLSIDQFGDISGTAPNIRTIYTFSVTARDAFGGSTVRTFTVSVNTLTNGAIAQADLSQSGTESSLVSSSEMLLPLATVSTADVLADVRPTDASGLHSYFYYDGAGRLVGTVNERGFLSETVYKDDVNAQDSVQYLQAVTVSAGDTLADLKARALANNGKKETTSTTYDEVGRVSAATGVDGTRTHNFYDSAGRLTRQVYAEGQQEDDGRSAERGSRTSYNVFSEVTGTVGGVGDAWLLANPSKTLADALAQFGVRYEYDSLGRKTKAIDANGHVTLYYYDSEDRLRFTVNAKGEVAETQYTAFGQVSQVREYSVRIVSTGTNPPLTQLQSAGGGAITSLLTTQIATIKDDVHDRLTSYLYDQRGLAKRVTDAEGYRTDNTYTAFGELETIQRTIAKDGSGTPTSTTTTRLGYDLAGQLISTTGDVGAINANTQSVYDAYGRVIRAIDAAGKVTVTNYDQDSGRTIVVSDALGRQLSTEYDAYGRVLKVYDAVQMAITDASQRKATTYEYDNTTRTLKVTTPEGIVVRTVKTRSGETLSVEDGRQKKTSYTYDKNGALLTVTDALGHQVTLNEYEDSGRLKRTTDARGTVTEYSYDEVNRVITRQVDPSGLNLRTTYEFDAFGGQVTVTEGSGTAVAQVTKYEYDRVGHAFRVTVDPDGLKLTTTYQFDGVGNTVQVSRGTLASPNQLVTQVQFDQLGRRVKEIQAPSAVVGSGSARARDLTTEYRYDLAGRVTRTIDAAGNSIWFVYDDAGRLLQTIDALGAVSENSYDADGRLTRTLRYHNLVEVPVGDSAALQAPGRSLADRVSYQVYDADGRVRYTLAALDGESWTIGQSFYDANGNVIETRTYDKTLSNDRIDAIDTGGVITQAALAAELSALGYDESTASTLGAVRRTRYAYDAVNRLRFTVDALGGVTERAYDAAGNVLTQTAFATIPTLTAYDEASINGAVSRGNSANRMTQYAYDAAGELRFTARQIAAPLSTTPAQWRVSEQVHDALGRVMQTIDYATLLTTAVDVNSVSAMMGAVVASDQDRISGALYDAAGELLYQVVAQTVTASRTGMKYVVTRRAYDALGHVVQSTTYAQALALTDLSLATLDATVAGTSVANDAKNRTTRFVFDAVGRERFVVAADGALSESVYDSMGRVTEVRQFTLRVEGSTAITEASLAALRGARSVGDGVTHGERYTYDAVGRKRSTTDALGFTERYDYSAVGDLEIRTDKQGRVWQYVFDLMGRVSDELSPVTSVQLSNGTTSTNRLRTHYAYDAFGNLRRKIEATGTIDQRFTDYDYDLLGRQIKTTLPGVYDPTLGRVVAASGASGAFVRTVETTYNVFGETVRLATRTGVGANDFKYEYQTYDNLGRQVHAVDALHHVTKTRYTTFGEASTITRYSDAVDVGTPTAGNGLWSAEEIEARLTGDANARTVTMTYDVRGQKTQTVQSASSRYYVGSAAVGVSPATVADQAQAQVVKHEFDVFGDLVHEAVQIDTAGTGSANGAGTWRDTWHYFDVRGQEVLTVDALGYQTARSYDEVGNLKQVIEYARAGSPASSADSPPATPTLSNLGQASPDRITAFEYDAGNQQRRITRSNLRYTALEGTAYVEHLVPREGGIIVSQLTYDELGHLKTSSDALGRVTTFSYDELGHQKTITEPARLVANGSALNPFQSQITVSPVTTLTYDAFGQVVKQVRDPKGSGAVLTTVNTYDFAGNLVSTQDPSGATKRREYDYAGHVTKETLAVSVTAADLGLTGDLFANMSAYLARFSQTLERRYVYDVLGQLTNTLDVYQETHWGQDFDIDPTNDTTLVRKQSGTRSVYNAFGEVTDEYKVWGDGDTAVSALNQAQVAKYSYDGAGRLITRRSGEGEQQYYYDLAGHVTRVEQRNDAATDDGSVTRISETAYDLLGRATLQRLPQFTGRKLSGTSYVPAVLTPYLRQSFDRWGNVISRGQGDNVGSIAERTISYDYDQDNHVIAEHLPTQTGYLGAVAKTLNVTHVIRYDQLGRALQELDFADDASTQALEAIALRGTAGRRKQYNEAGQLTAEIDATDIRTDYAYDGNGNRVGTRDGAGAVLVDTVDANGRVLTHNLLTSSGLLTLCRYQYDQAGRTVLQAEYTNDTQQRVQQYVTYTQYDERNAIRQVARLARAATEFASGLEIEHTYGYDVLGNKNLDIDTNGLMIDGGSNFGGLTQSWIYNTADYTVGRLDSSSVGERTTTYQYTDFGQLWQQNFEGSDRTFTYLENGLRNTLSEHLQVANVLGQQLISDETTTNQYDSQGELVQESYTIDSTRGTTHTTLSRSLNTFYDELGRVSKVASTLAGDRFQSVTYGYDALSNRRVIQGDYENGDGVGAHEGWYDYDAEGRVTIVDGTRNGDAVSGEHGTTLIYDAVGRRAESIAAHGLGHLSIRVDGSATNYTWDEYLHERYSYNALGYLTQTEQTIDRLHFKANDVGDGVVEGTKYLTKETRSYDTTGRMVGSAVHAPAVAIGITGDDIVSVGGVVGTGNTYGGARGLLQHVDVLDPVANSSLDYHYLTNGQLHSYTDDRTNPSDHTVSHATYTYSYSQEARGMMEKTVTASLVAADGTRAPDAVTSSYYDANGNLAARSVGGEESSIQKFYYDPDGKIVKMINSDAQRPTTRDYYYAQGHEIAVLGEGLTEDREVNFRSAIFSNGYTPISAAYPGATPGSYLVNTGDTLSGIAQSLWGDGSLWYLLADENNVSVGPNEALPASEVGRTYRVPNVVTSVHNNADTFQPYSAAAIIGNGTPTLPPPPGESCDATKIVVLGVVVVAAAVIAVYTGGAASALGLGKVLGGVVGGVIGGAARQGLAAGADRLHLTNAPLQQGFDTDQLFIGGIGGALGGLVNGLEGIAAKNALMNPATGELETLFAAGGGFNNSFANILQGAVLNEVTSVMSGRGVSGEAQTNALFSLGGALLANAFTGGGDSFAASLAQSIASGAASAANPFDDQPFSWANLVSQAVNGAASVIGSELGSRLPMPHARATIITESSYAMPIDTVSPYDNQPQLTLAEWLDVFTGGDVISDSDYPSLAERIAEQTGIPVEDIEEVDFKPATDQDLARFKAAKRKGFSSSDALWATPEDKYDRIRALATFELKIPVPLVTSVDQPYGIAPESGGIVVVNTDGYVAGSEFDQDAAGTMIKLLNSLKGNPEYLSKAFDALSSTDTLKNLFMGQLEPARSNGLWQTLETGQLEPLLDLASGVASADVKARVFTAGAAVLARVQEGRKPGWWRDDIGFVHQDFLHLPVARTADAEAAVARGLETVLSSDPVGIARSLYQPDRDHFADALSGYVAATLKQEGGQEKLGSKLALLTQHFNEQVRDTNGALIYQDAAAAGWFNGGIAKGVAALELSSHEQAQTLKSLLQSASEYFVEPAAQAVSADIPGLGSIAQKSFDAFTEAAIDEAIKAFGTNDNAHFAEGLRQGSYPRSSNGRQLDSAAVQAFDHMWNLVVSKKI